MLDAESWEEVAAFAAKVEPSVFAGYLDQIGEYYNQADVLVERNNHGHTVLLKLKESGVLRVLNGFDDKPGWNTNVKGKPLLYNALAEAVRDQACTIRNSETASQIASIEASTLSAPEGLHDDRATSYALCIAALAYGSVGATAASIVAAGDPLGDYDKGGF